MTHKIKLTGSASLTGVNRRRRTAGLLLVLLLTTSLACISAEMVYQVIPDPSGDGEVKVTLDEHLTDAYLESARTINAEREQDYLAAGQPAPGKLLPESWQELLQDSVTTPEGFEMIAQDSQGFTAVGSYTFAEAADPEMTDGESLTISQDDPNLVRYALQIPIPELDLDVDELSQLREQGLGPKPPVVVDQQLSIESSGLFGLLEAFGETMSLAAEERSLDGWYLQRVLLEAGLPQITYRIELPGEIVAHEVDGQPAGTVAPDSNQVTLLVDETFYQLYGTGGHTFRVESEAHVCRELCRQQPHMIWDGVSDASSCSCICQLGWQTDDQGDCQACDQVCAAWDPNGVYNAAASEPNRCACRCQPGWEANEDETGCVKVNPPPAAGPAATAPAAATAQAAPPPTAPPSPGRSNDLLRDLETFLAGEGVSGPTAGQAAAGAAAVTALLGAWIATQLMAGASPEAVQQAVEQWQAQAGETQGSAFPSPDQGPSPAVETQDLASPPSGATVPAGEGLEERIERGAEDAGDYLDALDQSRQELQQLVDQIPDDIKNSGFWNDQVKPQLDQVNQWTDPSRAQQLVQEIRNLLAIRQNVEQRLPDLSPDQREGIVWTSRGLRALGDGASQLHQQLIIDPAKDAIKNTLPEEQAEQLNQVLDRHQQEIEQTAAEIADLPVTGAERVLGASQRDQLADPVVHEDAAGVWEPRQVETPDFGRGWRKVEGWYQDARNFLGQYIWQLRDHPPLPDD